MGSLRDKIEISQKIEEKHKNSKKREKIRKYDDAFRTEKKKKKKLRRRSYQRNCTGKKH